MGELSLVKKKFVLYANRVIMNGKISHSYLFEIDNYDDDFYYIMMFSKMILCNFSYEDVLNSSNSVINLVNQGNYPDIKIIEPDGNWIKKNQLISLKADYSNRSLLGNKRIYIIKYADKLNPYAANTILKFLEEPYDDIIAILVTKNRYHVIDTILSRCQIITLKDNSISFDNNDKMISLFKTLFNPSLFYIKYNYFYNNVLIDKNVAYSMFQNFENVIISFINSKYHDGSLIDDSILSIMNEVSYDKLFFILKTIEEELKKLKYNINYKLWLDSIFSKLSIGG